MPLLRTRLFLLLVLLLLLPLAACHHNPTAPITYGPGCKEHGIYPGGKVEAWTANCPVPVEKNGTWYGNPGDKVTDRDGNTWLVYYLIEYDVHQ